MTVPAVLNGGQYDPQQYGSEEDGGTGLESLDSTALQLPDDDELRRRGITALYGQNCPLASDDPESEPHDSDLVAWVTQLWDRHAAAASEPFIIADRNRGFRKSIQWQTRDSAQGPFKEPPQPRDAVRPVANMIRPALDQRIQILTEQRPGYRVELDADDQDTEDRVQAQQQALEYQFRQQDKRKLMREAAYWAQTDGVAYFFKYWDPDAGAWSEAYDPRGMRQKMGDIRTMVLRLEEVRVSANASSTQKPFYWIVKKATATAEAIQKYGERVLEGSSDTGGRTEGDSTITSRGFRQGALTSSPEDLLEDQATLDRYWLFLEPSDYFPQGFLVHVVGQAVVYAAPLECGVVPIVRVTDGSTDPSWYCEPIMNDWIDEQMRVNVLLRLWIEGIRRNVGGRFLHRANAIKQEQLVGGLTTMIEVSGAGGNLDDSMKAIPFVPIGSDIKELLTLAVKNFENKSGWNDTSRGSFTNDESGRAVLAQREILERIFSPAVEAMAEALSEDAKLDLAFMACYYDEPRRIAVVGENRPDLGRLVSAEDFDGVAEVYIDPETMMPLPRSLRLFLLDQMYDKGQMSAAEWRRRSPFASVRNLATPDDDQDAAARRLCERLRQGANPQAEQLWWQWNESIFQDVLERELILKDSVDGRIRLNADVMWKRLAQQASIKNGLLNPQPPAPAPGGAPGGGGKPGGANPKQGKKGAQPGAAGGMPANRSPLGTQSPGIAAAPMTMQTDATRAAAQFDQANAR